MSDRSDQGLPQDLAEVGELLRENRATASAFELDELKLRAKARARKRPEQLRRGVNVRSRSVTLILTLLLLGGTTAGGMAWGGGGNDNGDGAAKAQYRPPRCSKDMRECECPEGYSLTVQNNQIVCSKNPGGGGDGGGDHGGHGGDGGHGHHHHGHWRQGGNGHWQCSDDGHHWRDWNGSESDW
jgi:hypothetical protein